MKATSVIAAVAVATVLASLGACSDGGSSDRHGRHDRPGRGQQGAPDDQPGKRRSEPIGDGSTADTGPQPNQPAVKRLVPGERPPQFVVFSWDGAGEDGNHLFSHFRELGKRHRASMTYFLSGVYLLPDSARHRYDPPRHPRGSSDIGFTSEENLVATVEQLRLAWLEGNEIGTHFNGHFCGPNDGVGTWTPAEWKSEINQAKSFVTTWRTTTGRDDIDPLPFDYEKELVGGRAPCLEGQQNLIAAAKEMGFRYDASSPGGLQVWPKKIDGIWDFPLQQVPFPGRKFETLSMDYNFLANQSGSVQGDPAMHDTWHQQTRDGLLAGFERVYEGNRAPLFIGNHFEQWNGGIYMRAVEEVIKTVCTKEEVRCVSFRQLADWLDAQDPEVLERLRTLEVGQQPEWSTFLGAAASDVTQG